MKRQQTILFRGEKLELPNSSGSTIVEVHHPETLQQAIDRLEASGKRVFGIEPVRSWQSITYRLEVYPK